MGPQIKTKAHEAHEAKPGLAPSDETRKSFRTFKKLKKNCLETKVLGFLSMPHSAPEAAPVLRGPQAKSSRNLDVGSFLKLSEGKRRKIKMKTMRERTRFSSGVTQLHVAYTDGQGVGHRMVLLGAPELSVKNK